MPHRTGKGLPTDLEKLIQERQEAQRVIRQQNEVANFHWSRIMDLEGSVGFLQQQANAAPQEGTSSGNAAVPSGPSKEGSKEKSAEAKKAPSVAGSNKDKGKDKAADPPQPHPWEPSSSKFYSGAHWDDPKGKWLWPNRHNNNEPVELRNRKGKEWDIVAPVLSPGVKPSFPQPDPRGLRARTNGQPRSAWIATKPDGSWGYLPVSGEDGPSVRGSRNGSPAPAATTVPARAHRSPISRGRSPARRPSPPQSGRSQPTWGTVHPLAYVGLGALCAGGPFRQQSNLSQQQQRNASSGRRP